MLFRSRRDDIEDEDDQESFFRVMKEVPLEYYPDDDEEIDYDSDGNPIAPPRSKVLLILVSAHWLTALVDCYTVEMIHKLLAYFCYGR